MKNYYRVMLGKNSAFADEAKRDGFIGADFGLEIDLSQKLPEDKKEFNKKFIPVFLEIFPDKTKMAAALSCGFLYTIAKGINVGDVVLCPDGKGAYLVGEVISDYRYAKGQPLPHRRMVNWLPGLIQRSEMSKSLQYATGSIGTVSTVSGYAEEIEGLITGNRTTDTLMVSEGIEDLSIFALEKHLEDFLVENWHKTELGKEYDIFEVDGELVGQQYPTDTGPIDILAISKDKKKILVVELKKGRVGDVVVGQIQRYMGYIQDELANKNQTVKGVIIAFEEDLRITRALSVAQNIYFYTYKVGFKLEKK